MKLEVATPQDSELLKNFHSQFPTVLHRAGRLTFIGERPHSFFDIYSKQSDEYLTYTLKDESGELQAMASFVFKNTMFRGSHHRVGYATDLRVAPTRKATLAWVKNFEPVLKQLIEEKKLNALFSFINMSDSVALNNFVRPRPVRRPLPRYHLYRKFSLVTLHGPYPWAPELLENVNFEQGNVGNYPEILKYIYDRSRYRDFCSFSNLSELQFNVEKRLGLTPQNFIFATDRHHRAIGCLAVFPSESFLRIKPLSWSSQAANLRQFLNFISFFGFARPLTEKSAQDGSEFIPMNIGHFLYAENEDVLEGLFAKAFEIFPKGSLSYVQVDQDYKLRPPKSWISTQVPFGLYALTLPGEPRPEFLDPQNFLNPEIEPFSILS